MTHAQSCLTLCHPMDCSLPGQEGKTRPFIYEGSEGGLDPSRLQILPGGGGGCSLPSTVASLCSFSLTLTVSHYFWCLRPPHCFSLLSCSSVNSSFVSLFN